MKRYYVFDWNKSILFIRNRTTPKSFALVEVEEISGGVTTSWVKIVRIITEIMFPFMTGNMLEVKSGSLFEDLDEAKHYSIKAIWK